MERRDRAVEYKHTGCNCAQAMLLAFQDVSGLDEEMLKKIGVCFGSGMGGMDGDCGALTGAEMILGLVKYQGARMHRESKALYNEFVSRSGASKCRDLKGVDSGTVLCSCDDCIRHAVDILNETFREG